MSSRRCFFPAATSARWPFTARSTISPWPGARPLHLSASFILEEGFPLADLQRIAAQHGRGGARGGRQDRHRRHQGGRARQGGRGVHLHRRHRNRARRAQSLRRSGAAGRCRSWFPARSAIMASPSCRAARTCNSRRRFFRTWPRCTAWSRPWSRPAGRPCG